jgi:transcriptional regulator with XRE-family HTH domain
MNVEGVDMHYTQRIRDLREDLDLRQKDVAKLLNVGQKTYSDYELGKSRIPVDSIIILAKFYNVSVDYICGVSDIKNEFPLK